MNFVLPFSKLNKKSVSIAGGKGAQLSEMFNAGIPVPNGFVILADSFNYFIEYNNLENEIEAELKKVNAKKTDSVNKASFNIRKKISEKKIPEEIQEKILKEFSVLNTGFVAVRSSATAEDAKDASWAGELETYTHIQKKGLLNAVKKCWSSLFTPRAIFYRIEKKLTGKISVGVVVQKMAESDASGVVFTVNPVTKNRDEIIIEAAFGLGESVVSGIVTPDHYVVNKKEMFIENIEVNKQEFMLTLKSGKTQKIKVKKDEQENQKMSGQKIIELAELCKKIELHYGFPQDIEFGIEKNKIFILQARPVTTL